MNVNGAFLEHQNLSKMLLNVSNEVHQVIIDIQKCKLCKICVCFISKS